MAHGPIPDAQTVYEQAVAAGFMPTASQVRLLESSLQGAGERMGQSMQLASHRLRRAGNAYGKALFAEIAANPETFKKLRELSADLPR